MKNARKFGLLEVGLRSPDYIEIAKRIQSVIGTVLQHDSEERLCKLETLETKVEYGQPLIIDEWRQ